MDYTNTIQWVQSISKATFNEYSPSQKLHSRRAQALLPFTATLLYTAVARNVEDETKQRQQTAKFWYDKTVKSLPELQIGQG